MNLTAAQLEVLIGKKRAKALLGDKTCRKQKNKKTSEGEEALALALRTHGVAFEREFRFCTTRQWRADFRIGSLLVEIEGGVWTGGRHTRGSGYQADLEKYNAAALGGWTLLRYTTAQAKNGTALAEILATLAKDGKSK